ncbi:hypothetical protein BJ322DRAFT_1218963 [Thelephora terrestris]|uniref:Uncharacterized protein n=1 Tax=Thelephora terrestris TaxID=56493 RepID=A0A9P6HE79_9AGAM|nr:hypothetical protein BJ322DRAFT_1218963 [Thelephora terrestris]
MPPSASTDSDKLTQRDRPVGANHGAREGDHITQTRPELIIGRVQTSARNTRDIFRRNVTLKSDFGQLEETSHNFLFVSHHLFEVASGTPELWGFWATTWKIGQNDTSDTQRPHSTMEDHKNGALSTPACKTRSRIEPSGGPYGASISTPIQNSSTLLSLLARCEEIRSISVESVVLQCDNDNGYYESPDISDFLAYYHFHKLQHLELHNCTISSWDLMVLNTSVLTTLSLVSQYPSPTITLSQLLSILRPNPYLEEITLDGCTVPSDGGGETSRVQLAHLRALTLAGRTRPVFTLLHLLYYPRNLNCLFIDLLDTGVGNISGIIGPYLQDYLRRRGRSRNGLRLYLSTDEDRIRFRGFWVASPCAAPILAVICTTTPHLIVRLDQGAHEITLALRIWSALVVGPPEPVHTIPVKIAGKGSGRLSFPITPYIEAQTATWSDVIARISLR